MVRFVPKASPDTVWGKSSPAHRCEDKAEGHPLYREERHEMGKQDCPENSNYLIVACRCGAGKPNRGRGLRRRAAQLRLKGKSRRLGRRETDLSHGNRDGFPARIERSQISRGWWRCWQTNANSSLFAQTRRALGRAELTPLGKSSGAVQLEILSVVESALLIEMVMDRCVDGCEFLQCSHSPEAEHGPLPPSKRLV